VPRTLRRPIGFQKDPIVMGFAVLSLSPNFGQSNKVHFDLP
jgi:hypothetical protein